ncbi:MAG: hypothetical protein IT260_02830 [Saprospiraceae bacterium]|nr:hypothetical protein [Saprospiraceae bacterium]
MKKPDLPVWLLLSGLFFCFSTCTQSQTPAPAFSVIQFREPYESSRIVLSKDLSIPAEEAGYTLFLPQGEVKGMVVFFKAGRDTSSRDYEMQLYREAVKKQVATLYVSTGNPVEFLFDSLRHVQLDRYISSVVATHKIPAGRLLFAGMSLGGTRALKFGAWCLDGKSASQLRPCAIAICDAPIDFHRFWRELSRSIRLNLNPISVNEAQWVSAQLEAHLGGTPADNPDAYTRYSPYVYGLSPDPRLKIFEKTAIRAYTEPDIHWWMANRNKDFNGMNAIDAAALINDLHIAGHPAAALITTTDKGRQPSGARHPHSWSIVDNAELIDWLLGLP